jgi:hypothetical protein
MPASLWQVKPAFNVGAKFLQTVWKRLRLSGDNSPKLLSGDICVVWRRMPGPQGSAFHPRDGRHHGLDAENVERPPQLGERAVRLNAARPLSRPRSPWFIPCLMLPCSTVSRRRASPSVAPPCVRAPPRSPDPRPGADWPCRADAADRRGKPPDCCHRSSSNPALMVRTDVHILAGIMAERVLAEQTNHCAPTIRAGAWEQGASAPPFRSRDGLDLEGGTGGGGSPFPGADSG